MQRLSETWLITVCGNKKFALNSIYVESVKSFNNAGCITTVVHPGIYRGTFKLSNDNLIVLDGRKILGEETTVEITNSFKHSLGQITLDILEIQNKIQLYLITNHSKTENKQIELVNAFTKTLDNLNNFLNSLSDKICKNKYRVNRSVLEVKLLFNKVIEEMDKDNTENAWQTYKQIEYAVTKLRLELEKLDTDYCRSFNEQCIIIKYKENKYGLIVDKLETVSTEVELLKPNEDCYTYKAIAGLCKYQTLEYYVFNIKYLTELAKRFQKST